MPEIYHEQFEQKWEHPHDTTTLETNKQASFFWKGKECPHGPVQSLGLWVWQCHHGFCRLHRLSLPFVMPEIYHEQFEQKMGTPTRHYHHYTDESIIKSGRPMSSALISQPFLLTLPCCTGGTSFMKSTWDDNAGRVHSSAWVRVGMVQTNQDKVLTLTLETNNKRQCFQMNGK